MRVLRSACVMVSLLAAGAAPAADDAVVDQLRNDVRTLEREVRELSRRLDQLQQSQRTATPAPGVTRWTTAPDPDPSRLQGDRVAEVRRPELRQVGK